MVMMVPFQELKQENNVFLGVILVVVRIQRCTLTIIAETLTNQQPQQFGVIIAQADNGNIVTQDTRITQ